MGWMRDAWEFWTGGDNTNEAGLLNRGLPIEIRATWSKTVEPGEYMGTGELLGYMCGNCGACYDFDEEGVVCDFCRTYVNVEIRDDANGRRKYDEMQPYRDLSPYSLTGSRYL